MLSGKRSLFVVAIAVNTVVENVHVEEPAVTVNTSVPALTGVPEATSEMVCTPPDENVPELVKL